MKFPAAIVLLATTAAAAPTGLERRQLGGMTENELTSGTCRKITLVFARGSTEMGNMGSSLGPPTCSGLKRHYGETAVACQGVGRPYTAGIGENALPGDGTSAAAYGEAERLFNLAATKCPETIIVGAGYSQGSAVMVASVRRLPDATKAKIAGVVLYGNTRNRQEHGKIPNFPEDKALTICHASDGVCGGALLVTAGHLTYQPDVPKAVTWLEGRISAQGSGGAASGATAAASADGSATASGDDSSSGGGSSTGSGLGGLSGLSGLSGGGSGGSGLSALSGGSMLGGGLGGGVGGDSAAAADTTGVDSSSADTSGSGSSSAGGGRFGSLLSRFRGGGMGGGM